MQPSLVTRASPSPIGTISAVSLPACWAAAARAGDVEPLLALGKGAADDEVLEVAYRNAGALDQPADHRRGEIVGPHPGERALAGEMEGRAGIAGDHHVLHRALLSWSGPAAAACSATRTFLSILPIAVLGKDVRNS